MKNYLILLIFVGASLSAFAQTCTTFPCVVASVTLKNQTQAVQSTTLFTPTTDGVFRASAYLTTTGSSNHNSLWVVDIGWTDINGVRAYNSVANQSTSNAINATSAFQDIGGQPILFKTAFVQGQGSSQRMSYSLFIVVEQLE